jgi:hypothetical protein
MHDIVMGGSVTGIFHLGNKPPIEWYSKKQATVETATYGSEFVADRRCVDQIIKIFRRAYQGEKLHIWR